jgi:glycosyltransferase involved in cell wall biosynthesis
VRTLLLGTYPIERPVHGGQRRAAEIRAVYRDTGAECLYLAVYPRGRFSGEPASDRNFVYKHRRIGWCEPTAYSEDIFSGLYGAADSDCRSWLMRHLRRFQPTHVHLEQPFMWPTVKRLREECGADWSIVYSSQNIEAPLKRRTLKECGATPDYIERAGVLVENIERELTRCADLVVCASDHEKSYYEHLGALEIIVCRNGAGRSPRFEPGMESRTAQDSDPYFLTVGSGHLPNSKGFADLMLDPALFFLPPRRSLVVAGGMSGLLELDPRFAAYRRSNLRRAEVRGVISDDELDALKARAHGFLLPLRDGGGTNLKTAEAIISGRWVVATSVAMRGFPEFLDEPGILVEDDSRSFRRTVRELLREPGLRLDDAAWRKRDLVSWGNSLAPLREWAMRQR